MRQLNRGTVYHERATGSRPRHARPPWEADRMLYCLDQMPDESLDKLTRASIAHDYNPYSLFDWPERLPADAWWMSRELLTVYDTPAMERLDTSTLQALSRWESIHFYSLNVHGIRELLAAVVQRIHAPGYGAWSEFFHRFIAEENDHMWFFAQFCLRYGAKIYPDKSIKTPPPSLDPEAETFLVFARILLFEELVDHFNTRMAQDESLPDIVRHLNRVHHEDESRHIAAGRHFVKELHARLSSRLAPAALLELDVYLRRYLQAMLEMLYNPAVYRDAGVADPYAFRAALLDQPTRKLHHRKFVQRTLGFLSSHKILSGPDALS